MTNMKHSCPDCDDRSRFNLEKGTWPEGESCKACCLPCSVCASGCCYCITGCCYNVKNFCIKPIIGGCIIPIYACLCAPLCDCVGNSLGDVCTNTGTCFRQCFSCFRE